MTATAVTVVLVLGPGVGEPLVSLHAHRDGAHAALAERARTLLADRLGYVPTRLQAATPPLVDLVDALAGIGLTATVEDLPVEP